MDVVPQREQGSAEFNKGSNYKNGKGREVCSTQAPHGFAAGFVGLNSHSPTEAEARDSGFSCGKLGQPS